MDSIIGNVLGAIIQGLFGVGSVYLTHQLMCRRDEMRQRKTADQSTPADRSVQAPSSSQQVKQEVSNFDQPVFPNVFTHRNIVGAVLIAGIATGIYLGDFSKGLGFVPSGPNASNASPKSGRTPTDNTKASDNIDQSPSAPEATITPLTVLKVIIADKSYFVRTAECVQPIELKQLVALAKTTSGDEDNIRVRIYRRLSSTSIAEIELHNALQAAGISDDATVWVAHPIED